jgi:hypothetical protein
LLALQRIIEHSLVQLVNQQRWLDGHTGQHRLLPSPTLWSVYSELGSVTTMGSPLHLKCQGAVQTRCTCCIRVLQDTPFSDGCSYMSWCPRAHRSQTQILRLSPTSALLVRGDMLFGSMNHEVLTQVVT